MKMKGTNIFVKILEDSDAEGLLRLELRNRDFFQTYSYVMMLSTHWKVNGNESGKTIK